MWMNILTFTYQEGTLISVAVDFWSLVVVSFVVGATMSIGWVAGRRLLRLFVRWVADARAEIREEAGALGGETQP